MRGLIRFIGGALAVAYPFAVYFGLTRWDVRTLGILLALLFGVLTLFRVLGAGRGAALKPLLPVPMVVLSVLASAAWLDDERFLFAVPVLVNLALLAVFANTLRVGPPMIERFARMVRPDLPEHHRPHCRQFTYAWIFFFFMNSVLAITTGLVSRELWALYNGGIAYALMGGMFLLEYIVRRIRFAGDSAV